MEKCFWIENINFAIASLFIIPLTTSAFPHKRHHFCHSCAILAHQFCNNASNYFWLTLISKKINGFHAILTKKQQNKFHRILVKTQKYTNIDDQPEVGSPCVRQLSNVWWITKIIWCTVHIKILRAKRFFWIWWNLLLVFLKKGTIDEYSLCFLVF